MTPAEYLRRMAPAQGHADRHTFQDAADVLDRVIHIDAERDRVTMRGEVCNIENDEIGEFVTLGSSR